MKSPMEFGEPLFFTEDDKVPTSLVYYSEIDGRINVPGLEDPEGEFAFKRRVLPKQQKNNKFDKRYEYLHINIVRGPTMKNITRIWQNTAVNK